MALRTRSNSAAAADIKIGGGPSTILGSAMFSMKKGRGRSKTLTGVPTQAMSELDFINNKHDRALEASSDSGVADIESMNLSGGSTSSLPRRKSIAEMRRGLRRSITQLADAISGQLSFGLDYRECLEVQLDIDEDDLFADIAGGIAGNGKFLDTYTRDEMDALLQSRPRLFEQLASLGFTKLSVSLEVPGPSASKQPHKLLLRDLGAHVVFPPADNAAKSHYVSTHCSNADTINSKDKGVLLMELACRILHSADELKGIRMPHYRDPRTRALLDSFHHDWKDLDILAADWLLLQNPTVQFAPNEHPMPGQNYPGLRCGRMISELIIELSTKRGRDGVSNEPLYYHNAYMYATANCLFINPEFEGIFSTLCADLAPAIADPRIGLAVVSHAVFAGRVFHVPTGKRIKWIPSQTQICPVSARMNSYIKSAAYTAIRDAYTTSGLFRLELDDLGFTSDQDWADAVSLEDVEFPATASASSKPQRRRSTVSKYAQRLLSSSGYLFSRGAPSA